MDPTTEYLIDYACQSTYGDLSPEARPFSVRAGAGR
jgi:hypothetical protein